MSDWALRGDDWRPQSIRWGSTPQLFNPVRYIYIDEAGRSKKEPVTVVVGIVVNADSQYGALERELANLVTTVPEPLRSRGFVSHIGDLLFTRDETITSVWPEERRKEFVLSLVSIPSRISLAITVGFVARGHPGDPDGEIQPDFDYHQIKAFALCVAQADRYIRDNCGKHEVATVVAENSNHLNTKLLEAVERLKSKPLIIPPSAIVLASTPSATIPVDHYSVSRVRDTVHFVEKKHSPLLQLADACAYSLSRFFKKKYFGRELLAAMARNDERIVKTFESVIVDGSEWGSSQLLNPQSSSIPYNYDWQVTAPISYP